MGLRLKWQRNLTQTVKAIKEQPQRIDDLEDKGIPEREAYRCLEVLMDADLINENKGEYMWNKDYEEFTTTEEYKQKMRHSESLVRDIKKHFGRKTLLYSENFHYFKKHLQEGYQNIYKLYKEWKNVYHDVKAARENFNEEIRRLISEEGFEIVEYHNLKEDRNQLSPEIFNIVEENLHLDRQGLQKPIKLEVKDEGIWTEGKTISKNRSMLEETQKLIETCIQSESAKNLYEQFAVIKEKERKMYAKLSGEISYICMNVIEDAVPLRGSCKRCKIIIGRSP